MSKKYINFEDLKTNISLPDFLITNLGWTVEKGSTSHNPKLRSPSDQVIVIKKNSKGHYTYFDVHNDSIRGKTIFDIMQEDIYQKTGVLPPIREIGEKLQSYVDSNKTVLPTASSYYINNSLLTNNEVLIIVRNLRPINDFTFLKNRKINSELCQSKVFDDVFFQKEHINKTTGEVFNNTCVKLFNEFGVQGISQRNDTFKGILGRKVDTVAFSNSKHLVGQDIDKLYIGESMIDLISHYQMNPSLFSKNILYASTEGSVTKEQLDTIYKVIDNRKPKEIILNFDNDLAGSIFSIKTVGLLLQKEGRIKSFDVGQDNEGINILITINNDDNVNEKIDKFFPRNLLIEYYEENHYSLKIINNDVIVTLPKSPKLIQDYTNNLINSLNQKLKQEIPKSKDFNQDLQNKLITQQKYI